MTIYDWGLTIDDWGRVAMRPTFRPSIVNLQSSISPCLRAFVASCLLMVLSCAALGDEPRDLIEHGNQQFAAERYAEALEAYEQVGDEADERIVAELLHNRAAAHFKLGQFDDARELWVRAAGLKDAAFEAAARYNLGNCDYADALKALEAQDAGTALELLDRALRQYQDALGLDPQRLDARANLELAAMLKKQIEEQAQQQPQSQPSEQDQDGEQQGESSSQPSSQPSQSDQQDQDQQSEEGDEQEQQDQSQQPSSQPDSQPTAESQPAEQPASEAGGEEEQQVVPIEMTKEEAERLLQMIRDAERQRRAILRAREAAGYEPVDKDW